MLVLPTGTPHDREFSDFYTSSFIQVKHRNIKGWRTYGASVDLGGIDYLVQLSAFEINDGGEDVLIFHDHNLLRREIKEKGLLAGPNPITNRGVTQETLSKNSLFNWLEKVKKNVLEQANGGSIVLGEKQNVITLLEDADFSTFLHESGHLFFEQYRHFANQPDAPEVIKRDMNTLLNHEGESIGKVVLIPPPAPSPK